jgi:hypothetical protein
MTSRLCVYCNKHVSSGVTAHGGLAHQYCYFYGNPPQVLTNFYSVLRSDADPLLVAELLVKYVPGETQATIINEYNRIMDIKHERRLMSTKEVYDSEVGDDD